jgi:Flp pilus assembly protein TadD
MLLQPYHECQEKKVLIMIIVNLEPPKISGQTCPGCKDPVVISGRELALVCTHRKIGNKRFSVASLALISCAVLSFSALSNCSAQAEKSNSSTRELFQQGEAALRSGNLAGAEVAFKRVAALDPRSAAAFSNLGVIEMRRHEWEKALVYLDKAAELAPAVTGIRLNIGLVYFRKGDYRSAISPFNKVVADEPASHQARYLLGLCYFFTNRPPEAVQTLEPLWGQESSNMNFLYVLSVGAYLAGNKQLEDRSLARLIEVGQDTPEFHLFLGKAHLNHMDYDGALQEFQHAAASDPRLPFVHFNLGLALMNKQNFQAARDEFQKDIELEPDVASNYDQLGTVYSYLNNPSEAERCFKEAIKRDAHLASARFGLGKLWRDQGRYSQALAELSIAEQLMPDDQHIHFVRGQVLVRLGRKEEARREMKIAADMDAQSLMRNRRIETQTVPSPEVISEPR